MGLLPDGDRRTEISGPNITESGISLRRHQGAYLDDCLPTSPSFLPHGDHAASSTHNDLGLSLQPAGILATIGASVWQDGLASSCIDRVGTGLHPCLFHSLSAFLAISWRKHGCSSSLPLCKFGHAYSTLSLSLPFRIRSHESCSVCLPALRGGIGPVLRDIFRRHRKYGPPSGSAAAITLGFGLLLSLRQKPRPRGTLDTGLKGSKVLAAPVQDPGQSEAYAVAIIFPLFEELNIID
jgi:hypothetical protein